MGRKSQSKGRINNEYYALRKRYSKAFKVPMTQVDWLVYRKVAAELENEILNRNKIIRESKGNKKGDSYFF